MQQHSRTRPLRLTSRASEVSYNVKICGMYISQSLYIRWRVCRLHQKVAKKVTGAILARNVLLVTLLPYAISIVGICDLLLYRSVCSGGDDGRMQVIN